MHHVHVGFTCRLLVYVIYAKFLFQPLEIDGGVRNARDSLGFFHSTLEVRMREGGRERMRGDR